MPTPTSTTTTKALIKKCKSLSSSLKQKSSPIKKPLKCAFLAVGGTKPNNIAQEQQEQQQQQDEQTLNRITVVGTETKPNNIQEKQDEKTTNEMIMTAQVQQNRRKSSSRRSMKNVGGGGSSSRASDIERLLDVDDGTTTTTNSSSQYYPGGESEHRHLQLTNDLKEATSNLMRNSITAQDAKRYRSRVIELQSKLLELSREQQQQYQQQQQDTNGIEKVFDRKQKLIQDEIEKNIIDNVSSMDNNNDTERRRTRTTPRASNNNSSQQQQQQQQQHQQQQHTERKRTTPRASNNNSSQQEPSMFSFEKKRTSSTVTASSITSAVSTTVIPMTPPPPDETEEDCNNSKSTKSSKQSKSTTSTSKRNKRDQAFILENDALIQMEKGDFDSSLKLLASVLAVRRARLTKEQKKHKDKRPRSLIVATNDVALTLVTFGFVLKRNGKYKPAEVMFKQSLRMYQSTASESKDGNKEDIENVKFEMNEMYMFQKRKREIDEREHERDIKLSKSAVTNASTVVRSNIKRRDDLPTTLVNKEIITMDDFNKTTRSTSYDSSDNEKQQQKKIPQQIEENADDDDDDESSDVFDDAAECSNESGGAMIQEQIHYDDSTISSSCLLYQNEHIHDHDHEQHADDVDADVDQHMETISNLTTRLKTADSMKLAKNAEEMIEIINMNDVLLMEKIENRKSYRNFKLLMRNGKLTKHVITSPLDEEGFLDDDDFDKNKKKKKKSSKTTIIVNNNNNDNDDDDNDEQLSC